MRRLVVCFDGTWNKVSNPTTVTNVVKFAEAVRPVAADGATQIVYYNSGVGTGDKLDRFLGGVFGRGVKDSVKRGLAFLALNYLPGDEIYIFGFSRGAFTARALAGVIGEAGVPRQAEFAQLERIWQFYEAKPSKRQPIDDLVQKAPIRCVGVWDTVGSYGVPAGFGIGGLARMIPALARGFDNTHIGDHIELGLHAVGVDEKRRPFAPTFWTIRKGEKPKGHVEQVWFPGVHANVGGSYADTGLSDIALIWMVARLQALGRDLFGGSALDFDTAFLAGKLTPNALGTIYRSNRGWPISTVLPYDRPVLHENAIDLGVLWNNENYNEEHINEMVHWSVDDRFGRKGLVDGGGATLYRPRGVKYPRERVTARTPEESALLSEILARHAPQAPADAEHSGPAARQDRAA
jgi:T6SS, Phospholipase effector Tle1-like, catalytic domain